MSKPEVIDVPWNMAPVPDFNSGIPFEIRFRHQPAVCAVM